MDANETKPNETKRHTKPTITTARLIYTKKYESLYNSWMYAVNIELWKEKKDYRELGLFSQGGGGKFDPSWSFGRPLQHSSRDGNNAWIGR